MIRRIVSYPRAQWSRSDAWDNCMRQQYPGLGGNLLHTRHADVWQVSWRKSHTGVSWRWYFDVCEHGTGNPRTCERCQDDEIASPDWHGLRNELERGAPAVVLADEDEYRKAH
jgi:hypothetical protein